MVPLGAADDWFVRVVIVYFENCERQGRFASARLKETMRYRQLLPPYLCLEDGGEIFHRLLTGERPPALGSIKGNNGITSMIVTALKGLERVTSKINFLGARGDSALAF